MKNNFNVIPNNTHIKPTNVAQFNTNHLIDTANSVKTHSLSNESTQNNKNDNLNISIQIQIKKQLDLLFKM